MFVQYTTYHEEGTYGGFTLNSTSSTDLNDTTTLEGILDFSTPTCVNQGLGCFDSIEIGAVTDLDDTCTGAQVCGAVGVTWDISNASPGDNATGTNLNYDPNWTNPTGTDATKVFFDSTDGTTPVNSDPWTTVTSYEPGTMIKLTEYFWRVDIVHAGGTETGDTYSFTTADGPPVDPGPSDGMVGGGNLPVRTDSGGIPFEIAN